MLSEYNKFIRTHLKGGKMTMKEAAKLWSSQKKKAHTFRFREEEIDKNAARVYDNSTHLDVQLEFKKHTVAKYKKKNLVDKVFKEGEFSLSLDALYNGDSPKETARRVMCSLLSQALDLGYIHEDNLISLFAIGEIDGSYVQLLRMYSRMGFEVYATKNIDSDIFEDIALGREPNLRSSSAYAFMGMSVGKLLKWCKGRY